MAKPTGAFNGEDNGDEQSDTMGRRMAKPTGSSTAEDDDDNDDNRL